MSTKKINITAKPNKKTITNADEWVQHRDAPSFEIPKAKKEAIKRLTIDIPESLHRKIKGECGSRGISIADEVRQLLLQKYGNTEK